MHAVFEWSWVMCPPISTHPRCKGVLEGFPQCPRTQKWKEKKKKKGWEDPGTIHKQWRHTLYKVFEWMTVPHHIHTLCSDRLGPLENDIILPTTPMGLECIRCIDFSFFWWHGLCDYAHVARPNQGGLKFCGVRESSSILDENDYSWKETPP